MYVVKTLFIPNWLSWSLTFLNSIGVTAVAILHIDQGPGLEESAKNFQTQLKLMFLYL